METHAKIWKRKTTLPFGLWSHQSSLLKMVSDSLIFVTNKHIHVNTGKDRYPQVIAVGTTAPKMLSVQLCEKCTGPSLCSLGSRYRRAATASLGVRPSESSSQCWRENPPKNTLTLIQYILQIRKDQCIYQNIFYDDVLCCTFFGLSFENTYTEFEFWSRRLSSTIKWWISLTGKADAKLQTQSLTEALSLWFFRDKNVKNNLKHMLLNSIVALDKHRKLAALWSCTRGALS